LWEKVDVTQVDRNDRTHFNPRVSNRSTLCCPGRIIDLNHNVTAAKIRAWLDRHQVRQYLSGCEADLLARKKANRSQQELHNLDWSIDALWALMWAGRLVNEMDFSQVIPETMYGMCPHVGSGDGPEKFSEKMSIRPFDELYRALDLHYRLHWYAVEYQLRGEHDAFDLSRFIERRRALEWVLTPDAAWDEVSMNT
jgi:hypothetical protein